MTKSWSISTVVLGGVLVLPGQAQPPSWALDSGLDIAVRQVSRPLTIDSQSGIEVTVRNLGSEPARVAKKLHYAIQLRAFDSNGVAIHGSTVFETFPGPRPQFVDIAAGDERVVLVSSSLRELGIASPGEYTLVAEYWHRVWRDGDGDHLSLRNPILKSKRIRIVVGR